MRYVRFKILVMLIFLALVHYAFAQTKISQGDDNYQSPQQQQGSQEAKEEPAQESLAVEVENKLCPTDLVKVAAENKYQYIYNGKIYNFDSQACIEVFKKDPKGYIAKWEKKERFRKINIIND